MPVDFQIYGETLLAVKFGSHVPLVPAGAFSGVGGFNLVPPVETTVLNTNLYPPGAFPAFYPPANGFSGAAYGLGLTKEAVRYVPHFFHRDVHIDEFGPHVPIDVQWKLAYVDIHATLIHYDPIILNTCASESMGGGYNQASRVAPHTTFDLGTYNAAGFTLGRNRLMYASGNHLFAVTLQTAKSPTDPLYAPPRILYRFRSCYMPVQPYVVPLGTDVSVATINFRAIPFQPMCSGVFSNTLGRFTYEVLSSGVVLWDSVGDDVNL